MMTFINLIENGRKLVSRLNRYAHVELSKIPAAERMASSEVYAWFRAARETITKAFGDPSQQLDRWDELQGEHSERSNREYSHGIYNESIAAIRQIHDSMGLLTKFEYLLNSVVDTPAVAKQVIRNNPWVSGSFYLLAFLSILLTLRIVFGQLSPWFLPPTIFGALLAATIIGAFQLKNDDRLKEKSFLKLMALSFRSFPLLGRLMHHDAPPRH